MNQGHHWQEFSLTTTLVQDQEVRGSGNCHFWQFNIKMKGRQNKIKHLVLILNDLTRNY
jgi:hypothetical protein